MTRFIFIALFIPLSILSAFAQTNLQRSVFFDKDKSEIKIESEMVTPHRARFSVHNEGSSIAPNVIEKILRPFFIDEDVMNHSTGMGLGLTICQTILKNHNSSLNIENASGGVLVSFELPCL